MTSILRGIKIVLNHNKQKDKKICENIKARNVNIFLLVFTSWLLISYCQRAIICAAPTFYLHIYPLVAQTQWIQQLPFFHRSLEKAKATVICTFQV